MNRIHALVCLAILASVGCGGSVVADGNGGNGGNGGGGGSAGEACPLGPGDSQVQSLVGKACVPAGGVCASNNGCGGCSITCTAGVWTSTNAQVCFSIGAGC